MKDSTPIAFAYYKDGKLIGYRADTAGTISKTSPKIYHYSKKQVETVLENIEYNVKNSKGIGDALLEVYGENPVATLLAKKELEVHELLQDKRAFKIRVVEAPEKEKEFNVETAQWEVNHWSYPHAEVKIWLQKPEEHNILETHYFSMEGRLNLQ